MPVEIVVEHVLTSVIIGATIVGLAFSPLPRAFAHRIMHGRKGEQPAEDPRVDELLEDNAMLRRQIEELEGRMEFTERVIARQQKSALPGNREDLA